VDHPLLLEASMKRPVSAFLSGVLLAGCGGIEQEIGQDVDAACAAMVWPDQLYDTRSCATTYHSVNSVYAIDFNGDQDWTKITNNGFANQSKFVVKAQSIPLLCGVYDSAGLPIVTQTASAFATCQVTWNATGFNKYYLLAANHGVAPPGSVFSERAPGYYQLMPADDEFLGSIFENPFELFLDPWQGYTDIEGGIQFPGDVDAFSFRAYGEKVSGKALHHIGLESVGDRGLQSAIVVVYDSEGKPIASTEGDGEGRGIDIELELGPTYFVTVEGQKESTGDYLFHAQADL
jgi:hypothetical protein